MRALIMSIPLQRKTIKNENAGTRLHNPWDPVTMKDKLCSNFFCRIHVTIHPTSVCNKGSFGYREKAFIQKKV